MNTADALQAGAFVFVVALLVKPVGAYLERVFERRHTFFDPLLLPAERLIHRLVGTNPKSEMDWVDLIRAVLWVAAFSTRTAHTHSRIRRR